MLKTTTSKAPAASGQTVAHRSKLKISSRQSSEVTDTGNRYGNVKDGPPRAKIPVVFSSKPSARADLSRRITFLSSLIVGSVKPGKNVAPSDEGFMKEYHSMGAVQRREHLKGLVAKFYELNGERGLAI